MKWIRTSTSAVIKVKLFDYAEVKRIDIGSSTECICVMYREWYVNSDKLKVNI